MLSSKIDRKALLFLKQIAKKEKKNSKGQRSKKIAVNTASQKVPENDSHVLQTQTENSGKLGCQANEVVTRAIADYEPYNQIPSEDVEAKIKEIVENEASAHVVDESLTLGPVVITPKRGQVHRLVDRRPELATEACDVCGYRSSKEGVQRHKQRRHPKTVYRCQVCQAGFGVRYDMRRHRLNHFEPWGQLNKRGQRLWVKNHPDIDPDSVHYSHFEENFVSEDTQSRDIGGSSEASNRVNDRRDAGRTDISIGSSTEGSNRANCRMDTESTDIGGSTEASNRVNCRTERDEMTQSLGIVGNDSCDTSTERVGKEAEMNTMAGKLQNGGSKLNNIHISGQDSTRTENSCSDKSLKKKIVPRYPPKDTSRVDCPVCHKNLPQRVLALHMRIHSNKPPMVCPYCAVEFSERCKMNVHIRAKHLQDYLCKLCGKSLASTTALKYHLQGAHSDKVICLFCQKKLSNQQSLHIHMQREHASHWRHSCHYCGKRFYDRQSLNYHRAIHLDSEAREEEKKHKCGVCGKLFLRKQTLRLHQNTHVGQKPFRCEICDKGFAFGSLLNKHLKVHSEVRDFPCPHCHKAFKFACKLKYHMILHTKERKHVCLKCDKIFTTSTALRRHSCKQRPHQFQKPVKLALQSPPQLLSSRSDPFQDFPAVPADPNTLYVCGVCNQAFANMEDASVHLQGHQDLAVVMEDSGDTCGQKTKLEAQTVVYREGEIDTTSATYMSESILGSETIIYDDGIGETMIISGDIKPDNLTNPSELNGSSIITDSHQIYISNDAEETVIFNSESQEFEETVEVSESFNMNHSKSHSSEGSSTYLSGILSQTAEQEEVTFVDSRVSDISSERVFIEQSTADTSDLENVKNVDRDSVIHEVVVGKTEDSGLGCEAVKEEFKSETVEECVVLEDMSCMKSST